RVKDQVRDLNRGFTFDSAWQDLRFAARALRKSPAFTAVAVLTLALGIGVNTAIFSVVYAVLLRALPYDRPDQLALIWSNYQQMGAPRAPAAGPMVAEIEQRAHLIQSIAAIWVGNATLTGDDNPEQIKIASVTTNFFQVLGVQPMLGRGFNS